MISKVHCTVKQMINIAEVIQISQKKIKEYGVYIGKQKNLKSHGLILKSQVKYLHHPLNQEKYRQEL